MVILKVSRVLFFILYFLFFLIIFVHSTKFKVFLVILEVSRLFWSIKKFGVFFVVLKFWGTLVIPMVSRVFWSFSWLFVVVSEVF